MSTQIGIRVVKEEIGQVIWQDAFFTDHGSSTFSFNQQERFL